MAVRSVGVTYKMFFAQTARGHREVRAFLRTLPPKHRAKCVDYLHRVRQQGTRLPTNIVKHLEDGLWEVRPEYGGIEYRFLIFLVGNKIGVVSALVKKRQKVERSVIERALRLMQEMQAQWQEEQNE
jgi:phage-related protein